MGPKIQSLVKHVYFIVGVTKKMKHFILDQAS